MSPKVFVTLAQDDCVCHGGESYAPRRQSPIANRQSSIVNAHLFPYDLPAPGAAAAAEDAARAGSAHGDRTAVLTSGPSALLLELGMFKHGLVSLALILSSASLASSQPGPPPPMPKTPLAQEVLSRLANELSGQMAFNNEVLLAGAPWVREPGEFAGTMFEAQKIYDLVKGYGIENTRIERYPSTADVRLPGGGRAVGDRAGAPAAGAARRRCRARRQRIRDGGRHRRADLHSADLGRRGEEDGGGWRPGEVPRQGGADVVARARGDGQGARRGRRSGVISFSSRERYFDPNQVVYSGRLLQEPEPQGRASTVSWRQWSELLEDVLRRPEGRRAREDADRDAARTSSRPSTAGSRAPSRTRKGVIFTAHLFEGYVKRGANDNMSGCVVQLEILRALTA